MYVNFIKFLEYEMETYTLKAENRSDSLSVEERTFEDIYNYNFQDNEKFIEGWRKVRDVIPKEKLDESLIRAEVYFYSRYLFSYYFILPLACVAKPKIYLCRKKPVYTAVKGQSF